MNFIVRPFFIVIAIIPLGAPPLQAQQFTHLNYPDTTIINHHIKSITTTYTGYKLAKKVVEFYAPNGNCTEKHEWHKDRTEQHFYFFYTNGLVDSICFRQLIWIHNNPLNTKDNNKETGTYAFTKTYSYNSTGDTITVWSYQDKMVPRLYTFMPVKQHEATIIVTNDSANRPLQITEVTQPRQATETIWNYDNQGRTTKLIYTTSLHDTLTIYLENKRGYYDSLHQVYHSYYSKNNNVVDSGTSIMKLNKQQQLITATSSNGTRYKYRWYKNGLLKAIITYRYCVRKSKSRRSYNFYKSKSP